METQKDIWITRYEIPKLVEPVAVVGSPGLRSIGKLAVDSLIVETKAQLIAELYSTHLPSIYQTMPSYAANPLLPGEGGVIVEHGSLDLPKVQFYACTEQSLILVRGYHPNFEGQYNVADDAVSFLSEKGVKRMVVIAGYGSKDKKVYCAANSPKLITEMKEKFDIGTGDQGPFLGFSGLVFGLAKLKNIEALCLFAATTPKEGDLEFPDKEAADRVLEKLKQVINTYKS